MRKTAYYKPDKREIYPEEALIRSALIDFYIKISGNNPAWSVSKNIRSTDLTISYGSITLKKLEKSNLLKLKKVGRSNVIILTDKGLELRESFIKLKKMLS